MMKAMTAERQILDEREIIVCGRPLRYCLFQSERGYGIEVRYAGDDATAFAGTDLLGAVSAYDKIVRGAVTPCTLADVLADLSAETAEV